MSSHRYVHNCECCKKLRRQIVAKIKATFNFIEAPLSPSEIVEAFEGVHYGEWTERPIRDAIWTCIERGLVTIDWSRKLCKKT